MEIWSSFSAIGNLVGSTSKLLVSIVVCSSAHFGQFFIPHTFDFFVVLATDVKQLNRTRCKTTAAKYISTIALCSTSILLLPFIYCARAFIMLRNWVN